VTEPDLLKLGSDASRAADRILFRAHQKTFGEAFLADTYDDVLDFIPIVGDIVGSGPRLLDATASKDELATIVRTANSAVGIIPVFGFFADLLFPASGIITYVDYQNCIKNGSSNEECLFPKETIERDIMELVK